MMTPSLNWTAMIEVYIQGIWSEHASKRNGDAHTPRLTSPDLSLEISTCMSYLSKLLWKKVAVEEKEERCGGGGRQVSG